MFETRGIGQTPSSLERCLVIIVIIFMPWYLIPRDLDIRRSKLYYNLLQHASW